MSELAPVSRLSRRSWVIGAAVFAAALVVFQLWPRDEARITRLLQDLCAALNQTREPASLAELRAALASSLVPAASVRVTELNEDAEGLGEIQARAGSLLSTVPLSFALSSVEVHLSGALARADFDLLVMPRGSGEQRRELRHSRARLRKGDGQWRIEAVEVDPVADSPPEARP